MPALPAVDHVVRVDFHMSQTDTPNMQNRLFFKYVGALSQADAATWCASMRSNWITHMGAHMANQVTLYKTVLTDLTSASAAQAIDTTTGAFAAGTSADIAGLSAVIQLKLARRYRGGHPRIYLPGVRATDVANLNQLTGGLISSLVTDIGAFISAVLTAVPVAAAPATHVNVSYFQGFHNITLPSGRTRSVPTLRGTPVVDTVLSYGVNPTLGMQRRRIGQP